MTASGDGQFGGVNLDGNSSLNTAGGNVAGRDQTIVHGDLYQGAPPQEPPPPPFMAPAYDATRFVEQPAELAELQRLLLDEVGKPVALTAALHGAGGFGKTALAARLCWVSISVE